MKLVSTMVPIVGYAEEAIPIVDFPLDLCLSKLSTKQAFPLLYYSTRIIPHRLVVNMTLSLMTKEDVQTFEQFWYSDLNNGLEPFRITLPIFGEDHQYVARFINGISANWKTDILPKDQTMQIEILENIEEKFNLDRFRVWLGTPTGGKVTFSVDGDVAVDWGYGLLDYYKAGEITGTPFGYMKIISREAIRQFSILDGDTIEHAIVERALDVRDARSMFASLPMLLSILFQDAPEFIQIDDLAYNTPLLCSVIGLDTRKAITGARAFKDSGILTIDIDTENMTLFTEMFMGALNLKCIQKLNTLKATDTTDMFTNTPSLVYPDVADQALILAGADWNNSESCADDYTRWLQNLIYDNNNIKKEFVDLVSASTNYNTILATGDGAIAVAKPILPISPDTLITEIGNELETPCGSDVDIDFKAVFAFENISHPDSTVDMLFTFSNLQDGDKLIIIKDDDSVHEMVAAFVQLPTYLPDGSTNTNTTDATQGGTGTPKASYNSPNAHLAFDDDRNTLWDGGYPESSLMWSFSTPTCINKYFVEEYGASNELDILEWVIEASNDGILWTELDAVSLGSTGKNYSGSFTNGAEYLHYSIRAIRIKNGWKFKIGTLKLYEAQLDFGDKYKKMSTTPVTMGEIPKKVFMVGGGIAFDFGNGFIDAVVNYTDYQVGLIIDDNNDPFGDGSLVARFPFDVDHQDVTGNLTTSNVNTVAFVNDDDLDRVVADFSGDRRYIQTDIKLGDDLNTNYTVTFRAKRNSDNTYDVPYTELSDAGWRRNGSGAHWQFDGDDCNSGGSSGSYAGTGRYKGVVKGGSAKKELCHFQDTKKWNRYTTAVGNGKRIKLFTNCSKIVDNNMPFFKGLSNLDLSIGALVKDRGTNHYNFDGRMCDFEIYNRPLTEEEVFTFCQRDTKKLIATIYYEPLIYASGTPELLAKVYLHKEGDSMIEMSAALSGRNKKVLQAKDSIGGEDATHWYLSKILINDYALCKE